MRSIKFRCWDQEKKKMFFYGWHGFMHNNKCLCFEDEKLEHSYIDDYYSENKQQGLLLMQFTGIKDINGKEIYEGDVLLISNSFSHRAGIYPVEYHEACYFVGGAWLSGAINCEIIGNIYENPELLK